MVYVTIKKHWGWEITTRVGSSDVVRKENKVTGISPVHYTPYIALHLYSVSTNLDAIYSLARTGCDQFFPSSVDVTFFGFHSLLNPSKSRKVEADTGPGSLDK